MQNKELENEAKTIIIVHGTPKEVTKEKRVITQTEAMQISSYIETPIVKRKIEHIRSNSIQCKKEFGTNFN